MRAGDTLTGYSRSPRHFANCTRELDADLQLKQLSRLYQSISREIAEPPHSVAVHVRRGGYLKQKNAQIHGVLAGTYYLRSLEILADCGSLGQVFVFSDANATDSLRTMNWPTGNKFVEPPLTSSALENLLAMPHASTVITANSSFSWWAGLLARCRSGSTVVAPNSWFRESRRSAEGLIPDEWLRLRADFRI